MVNLVAMSNNSYTTLAAFAEEEVISDTLMELCVRLSTFGRKMSFRRVTFSAHITNQFFGCFQRHPICTPIRGARHNVAALGWPCVCECGSRQSVLLDAFSPLHLVLSVIHVFVFRWKLLNFSKRVFLDSTDEFLCLSCRVSACFRSLHVGQRLNLSMFMVSPTLSDNFAQEFAAFRQESHGSFQLLAVRESLTPNIHK